MSDKHPVIAVTGACGAGTTSVQQTFKEIFFRQNIHAAFVEGNGFLRYSEDESRQRIQQAAQQGKAISCYGPELNDFTRLEACFRDYGEQGSCTCRSRIHNGNQHLFGGQPGDFTDWHPIPPNTDCLFYEGMHGGVKANSWTRRKSDQEHNGIDRRQGRDGVNAAQYVDLLIGVAPAINLEWMQRIKGDGLKLSHSVEEVTEHILQQLQDYIHFIVPQFSLADINFQRMPVVDTSNPFEVQPVPLEDESLVVVSFREPHKHDIDSYVSRIDGAAYSRRGSMIIPGGAMPVALDIICAPLIEQLVQG